MDSIDLNRILADKDPIPSCCRQCKHFDSEYNEGWLMGYWCNLNIKFPTKKKSCKRQSK